MKIETTLKAIQERSGGRLYDTDQVTGQTFDALLGKTITKQKELQHKLAATINLINEYAFQALYAGDPDEQSLRKTIQKIELLGQEAFEEVCKL